MSGGLKGDAKFYCAFHFRGGDASEAARITDESQGWDGKPESYLAMRFAAQRAASAYAGAIAREKQADSGVSGVVRNDAIGVTRLHELPKTMGELAGAFRNGLTEEEWSA